MVLFAAVPFLQSQPTTSTIDCRTDRWTYPACYQAKVGGALYQTGTDKQDIGANARILQLVQDCVKPGDMHAPACLELDRLLSQRLAAPQNLRLEDKRLSH